MKQINIHLRLQEASVTSKSLIFALGTETREFSLMGYRAGIGARSLCTPAQEARVISRVEVGGASRRHCAPLRRHTSNLNTDKSAPTKIARITFGFHTA